MRLSTRRGHSMLEVSSAMQKAVRRGDARLAGYWAIELYMSGYRDYVWRRLLVVSAEDCAGTVTHEIEALHRAWQAVVRGTSKPKDTTGRIFVAKATILLCLAAKSRDADHLTNLVYDAEAVDADAARAALDEARESPEAIPDYAYDVHTSRGRARGRTREEFFLAEHDALTPRAAGLFDRDVDALRAREPRDG